VHAIRDVLDGHIYVSEPVLANGSEPANKRSSSPKGRPLDQLTDLELEILESIGLGKTSSEIARQLELSVGAVISHRRKIKSKLNLNRADDLIRYAVCWVETGAT